MPEAGLTVIYTFCFVPNSTSCWLRLGFSFQTRMFYYLLPQYLNMHVMSFTYPIALMSKHKLSGFLDPGEDLRIKAFARLARANLAQFKTRNLLDCRTLLLDRLKETLRRPAISCDAYVYASRQFRRAYALLALASLLHSHISSNVATSKYRMIGHATTDCQSVQPINDQE